MKKYFLAAIIILAAVVRLVGLSSLPSGFTPDEASFGYDAYSLLTTGKDQWGNSYPLVFKSFGDYKLPLYGYLAMPSIAVFGLNEFAVRLPNAVVGTIAVLATYLLVNELTKKREIALLAALILSISPWHIPLSRGAFEANLTTALMPLMIYFYSRGLKNSRYFIVCSIFFALNLFSYHSARIVTPVILFTTIILYRPKIKLNRWVKVSISIVGISSVVATLLMFIGGSRLSSASIVSEAVNAGNIQYDAVLLGLSPFLSRLINNKVFYILEILWKNYLQYFSFEYLFINGPGEGTYGMRPGTGTLFLIDLAFISGYLLRLTQKRIEKLDLLLIIWILIAPIPAALSNGPGYAANRAAVMVPAIQIVAAIGGWFLLQFIKENTRKLALGTYLVFSVASSCLFLEKYVYHQPIEQGKQMIYGTSELVQYIKSVESTYQTIVISPSITEPQIYIAFYSKIDPRIFQDNSLNWDLSLSKTGWLDQLVDYKLGKYVFSSIDIPRLRNWENTLIVGTFEDFTNVIDITPKKVFSYKNGTPAYWVVDLDDTVYAFNSKI